ncbi:efflux RND transporter periplasmic adaptor subunit [Paenibacillus nasutitermitis]|uniref:MacA family efflux pump subunit n=1 Tax=Paenibacillus nasutitermitis TaxID=1652958 RepID=A0A916YJJ7_9BACL|nr:HlyD family efflux transporter periplasmic adaptor subunit [Paenibacillus nasutitermitis]GGD46702.1 MacA family efflux pump subunit [Paenibacillus nasutitermitis]
MPIIQMSRYKALSWMRLASYVCLAASLLSGCSLLPDEEETLQPPVQVKKQTNHETALVKKGSIEKYLSTTASALSSSNTSVSFPESGGQIKKLFVQTGELITAGSPIAELDTGDLQTRIKLQKLTVEQKQIIYSGAVKTGSSPKDSRLAQIDLDREQLILASLEKEYNKSLLLAPVSGKITYLSVPNPGEGVTAFQTIATIANPDAIELIYESTDVKNINGVKKDTDVTIKYKDKTYQGKVAQTPATAPKSDDPILQKRNAKALIIAFNSPKPTIEIGDYVDIKLFIEKKDNILIVPRSSLRTFLGRSTVQVIDGERVKELDVETGLMTSAEVEITKGLDEGQKVILG